MGLFDKFFKFKKRERPEKKFFGKQGTKSGSSDNVLDMVKEDSVAPTEKSQKPAQLKSSTGSAFRVLVRPEFSEKARMLAAAGKYVFVVHTQANKPEVKKAVEKVYDVHVVDVNMLRVSGKARRWGRVRGRTKSWKKAVVTLRANESIEGLVDVI